MFPTKKKKIKCSIIFLLMILFYYFEIYIPTGQDDKYDKEISELNQIKIVYFYSYRCPTDILKEKEYRKEQNKITDKNIKQLFSKINYKNNIGIRKNKITREIYVYTTPDMKHHNIKIYESDGETIKDEFVFYTPFEANMGVFDKKHYQVYMQIYKYEGMAGRMYQGNAKINVFIEYMLRDYLKGRIFYE